MTLRTARFRRRKTNFFFSCFPYLLSFSLFFSRPRPHPQSFQFPYETHQILHPRARLFLKMTCSVFYGEVISNRASNVLSLLWILTGRNEAYIIFYTDSLEGTDTLSSGVVMEVSIERNLIRQPATSFHPFSQERLVLATGTGASNVMILNNAVAQHCTHLLQSLFCNFNDLPSPQRRGMNVSNQDIFPAGHSLIEPVPDPASRLNAGLDQAIWDFFLTPSGT